MYWYLVQTLHNKFTGCGYSGGTTVLVLCIGIETRPQMANSMVVVVVVVPLYWYYLLVFSRDFL